MSHQGNVLAKPGASALERLPNELLIKIMKWLMLVDYKKFLESVPTVSKKLAAVAAGLIYHNPIVLSPSSVWKLLRTFETNPQRASLVSDLNIGLNNGVLPLNYEPIFESSLGGAMLASTLWTAKQLRCLYIGLEGGRPSVQSEHEALSGYLQYAYKAFNRENSIVGSANPWEKLEAIAVDLEPRSYYERACEGHGVDWPQRLAVLTPFINGENLKGVDILTQAIFEGPIEHFINAATSSGNVEERVLNKVYALNLGMFTQQDHDGIMVYLQGLLQKTRPSLVSLWLSHVVPFHTSKPEAEVKDTYSTLLATSAENLEALALNTYFSHPRTQRQLYGPTGRLDCLGPMKKLEYLRIPLWALVGHPLIEHTSEVDLHALEKRIEWLQLPEKLRILCLLELEDSVVSSTGKPVDEIKDCDSYDNEQNGHGSGYENENDDEDSEAEVEDSKDDDKAYDRNNDPYYVALQTLAGVCWRFRGLKKVVFKRRWQEQERWQGPVRKELKTLFAANGVQLKWSVRGVGNLPLYLAPGCTFRLGQYARRSVSKDMKTSLSKSNGF